MKKVPKDQILYSANGYAWAPTQFFDKFPEGHTIQIAKLPPDDRQRGMYGSLKHEYQKQISIQPVLSGYSPCKYQDWLNSSHKETASITIGSEVFYYKKNIETDCKEAEKKGFDRAVQILEDGFEDGKFYFSSNAAFDNMISYLRSYQ